MLTTIFNLTTGEERTYTLPVFEALRNAYYADRHQHNTWQYAEKDSPVKLSLSHRTAAAADWCAVMPVVPSDHA